MKETVKEMETSHVLSAKRLNGAVWTKRLGLYPTISVDAYSENIINVKIS